MESIRTGGRLSAATLVIAAFSGCSTPADSQEGESVTPIEGFPNASVTIFPLTIFWTGKWDSDAEHRAWADAYTGGFRESKARPLARTLGLLLEENGYDKYEVADAEFRFSMDAAARKKRAAAFGAYVSELDLKTDYALCTEFIHTGERSGVCEEVYLVIVDAKGRIAWEDSLKRGAGTELGAVELACGRLVQVMDLNGLPKKEMAEDKKRELREIRAKEPPSESESAAMKKRLEIMREAGRSAPMLVYPARVGGDHTDETCATRLSTLLNGAELCQAAAAETGPVMKGNGWPNEMQVLWLFARNVRAYVREHPVDSGYVLFADYWFNPRGQVWAVHFVVCDRAGEWVIADLQNSHQEAFRRINPKTLEDCDRLVLDRLATKLR
ncbi:MAG: hypothetical protein JXP34_11055 [Planctomycetes bacterium]|nr:hypothetical protein [Planctomycetota bacterium]